MWLLKMFLLVWCFMGTLAGPLDTGIPATDTSLTSDEYLEKFLERSKAISKVNLDQNEDWQKWQNILNSLQEPTEPPNVANFDNDYGTNTLVVPKYYDNNSYVYSSSSYSDYSGIIIIIVIIKIILIIACCGCRAAARRPSLARNGVAVRVPNAAQPSSLTIIRRHIFLVVPENNSQNVPTPDDSHDPASHLEQKCLLNEDLPPAYEDVAVSNGNPAAAATPNNV